MHRSAIAFTPGEPAGIGPDLAVMLAQSQQRVPLVYFADLDMLGARAERLSLPFSVYLCDSDRPPLQACCAGAAWVVPILAPAPIAPGVAETGNAGYVIKALKQATNACISGKFGALVTGPINKAVINRGGIPFTGHTEYLAHQTGGHAVMMLVSGNLRVALATTHLPLKQVSASIDHELLEAVLLTLHRDLQTRFGIAQPHILVCGLNPHAGESGYLGDEEIVTIGPVLAALRTRGLSLTGPLPADTLFTSRHLDRADAVLAMYHDQGLPVLKYAGFGAAVNVTLGLPIIRTSVDHGTAFDLAGSGRADSSSLQAAVNMAASICQQFR